MKFHFLPSLVIVLLLFSCNSRSGLKYSEWIVKQETDLVPDIRTTENKVAGFAQTGNYDSIAMVSEKMERRVDKALEEIKSKAAPDLKEAENFKQASIRYFAYMEGIYTSYKNLGLQKTDEGREKERQKMMAMVQKKQQVVFEMQEAQRKFATANGFKIQPPAYQQ